MGVIVRGRVVIAIVLLVGALPAGAANRSSPLRASANFDATGKITSQVPKGWISSSSYDQAKGTLVIGFATGLFSTTPSCTISNQGTRISGKQSPDLSFDAFPQPVSAYPDGVVILNSITPRGDSHSLPASEVVCVGTP
jgi:hypothetical protein